MEFSNLKTFKRYLLFRNLLLVMTGVGIIGIMTQEKNYLVNTLISVSTISLLLLLAFEAYIKPYYIKVCRSIENDMTYISLFVPDTRFFILFSKSKIPKKVIPLDAQINFSIDNASVLSKRLVLSFIQDDANYKIGDFNILWATNKDISNLIKIIDMHNERRDAAANKND